MRKAIIAATVAALLAAGAAQAQTQAPAAAQTAPAASDWRAIAPENLLVIDTSKGRVLVELIPVAAPNHAERIRTLANQGFYDGLKFHRVIPDFMAQTGDPKGTGEGGSELPDLKAEFSFRRGRDAGFVAVPSVGAGVRGLVGDLPVQTQPDAQMMVTADFKVDAHGLFCPGVLGMARSGSPDSANSQFFLMRQAYPALDKRYTVWGRVVSGLDVVRSLKASDTPDGLVQGPDQMTRVRVASDLPAAERPTAAVLNTNSATFQTLAQQARQARGADFSVCDIELPVRVTPAA
ncbi:peptidylprolyl isomerase [Brevundimonas sp. UBA7838]|uniref:peptidylprolyl isomerase n=1 Tax=Brevundimonas sp. UBA7838 TaxID=1946142 RepID=UPI0025B8C0A4|nr:peptidylprolyl isomerase [Brevundimonas sp. UBA7838]